MSTLDRRGFMKLAGAGLAASALPSAFRAQAAEPGKRPNVVFILTDDQNTDTLGCYGAKVLTPAIDRLARGGVRFTRAYTVHSVCTPSRYVCLTGQYASRSQDPFFAKASPAGTQSNIGFNVQITSETPNVARALHDAGYATGFVGKWHTGGPALVKYPIDGKFEDPEIAKILAENQQRIIQYIKQCGFDYAASVYRGNLKDHKFDALTLHNQEWVTKGALDFIDQYKDKPFFLHVCTTLQHGPNPLQSIPGDKRMTPAGLLSELPKVQAPRESIAPRVQKAGFEPNTAAATWLDDGVAAIVKKLEDLGLADNTLFLFFSDNGTVKGKGTCYDGGANTACLLNWKNRVPAGVVSDKLIANVDFAPTILDACGVKPPSGMRMDGQSLLPMLAGPDAPWRDTLMLEVGHTRAVRYGKWKYIALRYTAAMQEAIRSNSLDRKPYHMDTVFDLQKVAEANHPGYWDADQLYDLEKDPMEKTNLAKNSDCAKVLADMKERLKKELAKFPRPFGEFTQ
ncbi:MAG: sulfatase-like hydrolase/transferase [Candidatus Sumerlaeota bacterium]|nr:sulfatase-like hydrolase/transferase [Candidatus Sumerlaeota bacterium]